MTCGIREDGLWDLSDRGISNLPDDLERDRVLGGRDSKGADSCSLVEE